MAASRLAGALLSLGVCCLVRPAPALASLTHTDGGTSGSTASNNAVVPRADLSLPRVTPTGSAPRATQRPADDLGQFSATIDPERILREDFRLTPKLRSTPPAQSILLNAQSAAAPQPLPSPNDTDPSDDDRTSGGELAIPLPAIGAGWTLLIGAAMYQFGSRALRLRR